MRTNREVAAAFERQSQLLAIQRANPFRVRAYRNAAESIRKLGQPLYKLVAAGKDLTEIPAIGKDLAHQIEEVLDTGTSQTMIITERDVPLSLIELLELPDLGPARVNRLYRELGIATGDELENALRDGRVAALPGFGSLIVQRLLDSIGLIRSTTRRMLQSEAAAVAEPLLRYLESCPEVISTIVCGSSRRAKSTIGDLDIVIVSRQPERSLESAAKYRRIQSVEMEGATRSSFHLDDGTSVDLRAVRPAQAGSAALYFTGNKQHNVKLRQRAQRSGYKLNEYGLFAGEKRIAGRTERSIYKALGLGFIPPELRQGIDEIERAAAGELPKLIKIEDIKGDLHVIAPKQPAAITAMIRTASLINHQYIGLVVPWQEYGRDSQKQAALALAHFRKLRRAASEAPKLEVFTGLKVILPRSGKTDIPYELLDKTDYLIAAVSDDLYLSSKQQTDRVVAAISHPMVRILAHPLCRKLGYYPGITLDLDRVIRAAKEHTCFLEINGDPARLDLPDTYSRRAQQQGAVMTIGSGAEKPEVLEPHLRYGINNARRGWITRRAVVNCQSVDYLKAKFSTA